MTEIYSLRRRIGIWAMLGATAWCAMAAVGDAAMIALR